MNNEHRAPDLSPDPADPGATDPAGSPPVALVHSVMAAAAPAVASPRKPRIWTVLLALGSAAAGQLAAVVVVAGGAVVASLGGGWPPDPRDVAAVMTSPACIIGLLGVGTLVLASVAASAAALSPEPMGARLALRRSGLAPAALAVAAAGALSWSLSIGAAAQLLSLPPSQSVAWLTRTLVGSGGLLPVTAVVLGVAAPACEELFFRGYVQQRLCRRWGAGWGIAVTATVFGLVHFDLIQSPMTFLVGLYLGWLAHRSRSVVPSILAHTANNSFWAMLVVTRTAELPRWAYALLLPAALLGSGGTILWLHRRLPPTGATPGGAPTAAGG